MFVIGVELGPDFFERPGDAIVQVGRRVVDVEQVRRVELAGAREFELLVDDGGDGIACDQADWAEAKVTLKDGSDLWLSDLPLPG